MRRSGRTTRIKNFIVDQLLSVGGCIATDHTVFEHDVVPIDSLKHLIISVEKDVHEISNGMINVKYELHHTGGLRFIIFKTEYKTNNHDKRK